MLFSREEIYNLVLAKCLALRESYYHFDWYDFITDPIYDEKINMLGKDEQSFLKLLNEAAYAVSQLVDEMQELSPNSYEDIDEYYDDRYCLQEEIVDEALRYLHDYSY